MPLEAHPRRPGKHLARRRRVTRTCGDHLNEDRDDHCAHIYSKSLLYLVSNAFEEEYHPLKWGWPGAPLLGMEKFIRGDQEIHDLFANQSATWISPSNEPPPSKPPNPPATAASTMPTDRERHPRQNHRLIRHRSRAV